MHVPGPSPVVARLCAVVAVILTTSALAPARGMAATAPRQTLGVFAGPGDVAAVKAYEGRLGQPLARVHDFLARETWSAIENVGWWTSTWGASTYAGRMVFTVPMLPDTGGTLAAGAAGTYDEHFRTLARNLVAGGQGRATLRLGHEFNGNWYRWTIAVPGGPADYAAYWRRIVTAMRSVTGAAFRFDWSPISGGSYVDGRVVDAAAAYPGDAFVDYIGLDQYDQSWTADRADPERRWSEFMNQAFGLRWHQAFAQSHGKPMTFPEWGATIRTDGYGGGDDPAFITHMFDWIAANNVAYHMYFEYADGTIESRLFGGSFPLARARFLSLFGPAPAGGTTSTTGGVVTPKVKSPKRLRSIQLSVSALAATSARRCTSEKLAVQRRRLRHHAVGAEQRARALACRVAKRAAGRVVADQPLQRLR